mgnify:CR=1 FL=1
MARIFLLIDGYNLLHAAGLLHVDNRAVPRPGHLRAPDS